MQMSFVDGDLIAGARITQWNVIRLHQRGKRYVLTRNNETIGTYEKLDKSIEAFERATSGAV
jgi:hypothetical protein